MPTAAFTTLGCKVNQYETQKIIESFCGAGFEIAPFDSVADVYVINSCSVTGIAENKSHYTVRKALRTNPNAKVVITGCAAQMALNKEVSIPNAHLVVPNPEKLETLQKTLESFPDLRPHTSLTPKPAPRDRTRATLKIQDGCSVMCSYCSIPYTRPGLQSRPSQDIIDEARRMRELGYREIVLTGVLIGAYGESSGSGGPGFVQLIAALHESVPDVRLRVSSIEMRQVTPNFIDLLVAGAVVPHLHIPLQSGSSDTLKAMNRPYTQEDYLQLCANLRRRLPGISITTDIMVGFPTETEADFQESIKVCHEVGYLKAHVFRFSPRPGTPAAQWGDPIPPEEKQARAAKLAKVTAQTGASRVRETIGQVHRVLVESQRSKDGLLTGLTDHYVEVRFPGSSDWINQFVLVETHEESQGIAYGECVRQPFAARENSVQYLLPQTRV